MHRQMLRAIAAVGRPAAGYVGNTAQWSGMPSLAQNSRSLLRGIQFSTSTPLRNQGIPADNRLPEEIEAELKEVPAQEGAQEVKEATKENVMHSLPRDLTPEEIQAANAVEREVTVQRRGPPPPLPKFMAKSPKPHLKLRDALKWVKETSNGKFDETVDIVFNLGVDPKRSDQVVRGLAVLPHGVGKTARVAVFAKGKDAEDALKAGADVVGAEDLVARIKEGGSGAIDFDRAIGTPAVMPLLSAVARILGPRGLMPNPKLGTLTTDVAAAVKLAKQGQVEFRADKTAIVHAPIGKVSFELDLLEENAQALITAMITAKPKTLKGATATTGFILKTHVSSTMGRSVMVMKDSILEMSGFKK